MCTRYWGRPKFRSMCPSGFFCPAGSGRTMYGRMANDALNRGLLAKNIDPFLPPYIHENLLLPGELRPRNVNQHDQYCNDGINAENINILNDRLKFDYNGIDRISYEVVYGKYDVTAVFSKTPVFSSPYSQRRGLWGEFESGSTPSAWIGTRFEVIRFFSCTQVNGQCTVCGGTCDNKMAFSFRIDGSQVGKPEGRFPGMLFKSVDHGLDWNRYPSKINLAIENNLNVPEIINGE